MIWTRNPILFDFEAIPELTIAFNYYIYYRPPTATAERCYSNDRL